MKTSEDITKVYKSISTKIDDYIENWKVSPKNLKSYLSGRRLKSFLESEGLQDIEGVERIVNDILQDRISLEKELVKTFENFNLESTSGNNFWIGIGRATIDHEKILADHFDLSLSEVDVIDTDRHHFNAGGVEVVVFTGGDLEKISQNLKLSKINSISKMEIDFFTDIKIQLSDILDGEKLNSKLDELVSEGLGEMIREELNLMKFEMVGKNLVGYV